MIRVKKEKNGNVSMIKSQPSVDTIGLVKKIEQLQQELDIANLIIKQLGEQLDERLSELPEITEEKE